MTISRPGIVYGLELHEDAPTFSVYYDQTTSGTTYSIKTLDGRKLELVPAALKELAGALEIALADEEQ